MESSELGEWQKVEERLAVEVGALLLINKGGQEAANVSTWKAGPKLSPAETLLVRPQHPSTVQASEHSFVDLSRTTCCFHLTDSWPIPFRGLIAAHNPKHAAGSYLCIDITPPRKACLRLA